MESTEQPSAEAQETVTPAVAESAPATSESAAAPATPEPATVVPVAESPAKNGTERFDFRQTALLTTNELRRLRKRHDEYAQSLAARLSMTLRLDFELQVTKLQTTTFQNFSTSLGSPITHLTLFKVEPLRGIGVLEINPRLGLAIVDRLMGGAGRAPASNQDLNDVEVSLLDQISLVILGEWCNHWLRYQDLHASLLGHETSGRYLQTSPADSVVLVLTMQAKLGECTESLQIALPFVSMEPLIRQLNRELEKAEEKKPSPEVARPKWNPLLGEVTVAITAEWHRLELTAREVTRLKVGDVLELDPEAANCVQVRLGGKPKFIGRLGARGKRRAVELTEIVKP